MIEPQRGASHGTQPRLAKAPRSWIQRVLPVRPLLAMSGNGLPAPADSWVTLAGLAWETRAIRLGTMVTAGDVPPSLPVAAGGHRGMGPKRTPELAAKHSNEFSLTFRSVVDSEEQLGRVRDRDGRGQGRRGAAAGNRHRSWATLGRDAEAGASRSYLQILGLGDLDHLELIASAVHPQPG